MALSQHIEEIHVAVLSCVAQYEIVLAPESFGTAFQHYMGLGKGSFMVWYLNSLFYQKTIHAGKYDWLLARDSGQ